MAKFTRAGKHSAVLKKIELPNTESMRLHLVHIKARVATNIKFIFGSNIEASIKSAPFDGPKGIWVVDMKGANDGKTTLKAQFVW